MSGSKTVCSFYYFYFERDFDVLKSRSTYFLLTKNINVNKNKIELKMPNPTQFNRDEPCASVRLKIAN